MSSPISNNQLGPIEWALINQGFAATWRKNGHSRYPTPATLVRPALLSPDLPAEIWPTKYWPPKELRQQKKKTVEFIDLPKLKSLYDSKQSWDHRPTKTKIFIDDFLEIDDL